MCERCKILGDRINSRMVAPRRLKYREALFLIFLYVHGEATVNEYRQVFEYNLNYRNLKHRLGDKLGFITNSNVAVVCSKVPHYVNTYRLTQRGREFVENILLGVKNQESMAIIASP